jgi:hypothetical protein
MFNLSPLLQRGLGCGGSALMGQVEVQGDCIERMERFLFASGCVKGLRKELVKENKAAPGRSSKSSTERKEQPEKGAGKKLPVLPGDTRAATIAVKKMKPVDMKALLRARGLSTQGTRAELQERLLKS